MQIKKRFWTESEAAGLCGVPYWRLKYLRDTGRISPQRIGRALLYSESDMVIARALIDAQGNRYRRLNDGRKQYNKGDCK